MRFNPHKTNLILYYRDPLTGKEVSRSAKTRVRREAERAAARWEEELKANMVTPNPSWEVFRLRFDAEHLPNTAHRTETAYGTALNSFEEHIGKPRALSLITATVLSDFASKLRADGKSAATIGTYLTHVTSALSWAVKMGMIPNVPRCVIPRNKKRKLMRSRPITAAEFNRLVALIPKVLPDEAKEFVPNWTRFLRGLWFSGLRLGEAMALSWDAPPLRVDLEGRRPRIIAFGEGQKNRSDDVIPLTPDFYALLCETPADERTGKVFHLGLRRRLVIDTLSTLGRKSEIKVNESGKFVTAHDLRRSFGTRWALRVHPIVLQRIMRHKSMETTMRYYVDLDADDVADELWKPIEAPPSPDQRPDAAHEEHKNG